MTSHMMQERSHQTDKYPSHLIKMNSTEVVHFLADS